LIVAAVFALAPASDAVAVLCSKCREKVHDNQFGRCRECGANANSTSFQLCPKCSLKTMRCEWCYNRIVQGGDPSKRPPKIDPDKTATYKFGQWAYRLEVTGAGSSAARRGRLAYAGKEMVPPKLNDHHRTPWGKMYWVGSANETPGRRGWMQVPSPKGTMGKLLSAPLTAATGLDLTETQNGRTIAVVVGSPITIRLKGNPTTGYRWRSSELTGKAVQALSRRPTYTPDKGREGMVGSGGTFVFRFKATRAGKSTIKLVYDRSASAYGRPAKTFSVTIEAKEKRKDNA